MLFRHDGSELVALLTHTDSPTSRAIGAQGQPGGVKSDYRCTTERPENPRRSRYRPRRRL